MPILTRWFLKAALLYLLFALIAGIVLALPAASPITGFFPAYFHMLTFGWLTQLIFGVAFWMFPKYSPANPRGHEWLGWVTFISLNAGLVLRVIAEPINATTPSALSGWTMVASALLQWLSGVVFAINTWTRVKER
ncbi:MAG TPA: hypothetical protein PKK96_07195 [Anaerolineales bacterium]|nr:hypothetical protein [Anaerolineales bacterium]HNQ95092.1 hypothetical protein [Anaerolineales bacterium]HNS60774.1 hypothetical protein [Anaerolineales bacterium]